MIVLYPFLVIGVIVLGVMFLIERSNSNKALNEYRSIATEIGIEETDPNNVKTGMEKLGEVLKQYRNEANKSAKELEELQTADEVEGFGKITGSILPFVTNGSKLSQYQRVCALTVSNENKQYCVTTSATEKGYELVVPEGTYNVYAEIVASADSELAGYRAFYTEFVRCSAEGDSRKCSENQSKEYVDVEVKRGEVKADVDPADWNF